MPPPVAGPLHLRHPFRPATVSRQEPDRKVPPPVTGPLQLTLQSRPATVSRPAPDRKIPPVPRQPEYPGCPATMGQPLPERGSPPVPGPPLPQYPCCPASESQPAPDRELPQWSGWPQGRSAGSLVVGLRRRFPGRELWPRLPLFAAANRRTPPADSKPPAGRPAAGQLGRTRTGQCDRGRRYSTVTVLARLRGWSTSQPRRTAM